MTRSQEDVDRDLDDLWTVTRDLRHRVTENQERTEDRLADHHVWLTDLDIAVEGVEIIAAVSLCISVCALVVSIAGAIA